MGNISFDKSILLQDFKHRTVKVVDKFIFDDNMNEGVASATAHSLLAVSRAIESYESMLFYA